MATSGVHRGGTSAAESTNPMGTRKTLIIMVTVVGCIAILWPKVFYPMMVGPNGGAAGVGGQFKPNIIKDHRGSGCCDVVLDQEKFANASINAANQHDLFRKRNIGPAVEDGSIRQERPPHLRPETIHPAMRERGRAIPHVGSVHTERPQSAPRIVEGRPGPIPGMRPPMGAGSHQSTKSVNSMGFIMPLYTIGIVSFFIYTILKLLFKKNPATPYPEIKPDTTFREEVFTQDQYIKRPVESGKTKLEQPIGENGVVPASAGPVSNGNATSHGTSVQAQISVDYEQLAAKPERQTQDVPVMEQKHEQVQEQLNEAVHAELNNAVLTGSEQPKETECNESVADEHDDIVQPSYDPATEKVVDGIVVKRVVRIDEQETSVDSSTVEQVASQIFEEVIQEAEIVVNEEAEAAAVQMVEEVVQEAEAAAYGIEVGDDTDASAVQSFAAQEEVIVSDHATTAPDASEMTNGHAEETIETVDEYRSEQDEATKEDQPEDVKEQAKEALAVEHDSEVTTEEIAINTFTEQSLEHVEPAHEETATVEQESEVITEEIAIKEQQHDIQAVQPCEENPEVEQNLSVTSEEAFIKDVVEQIKEEQTEQVENVEAEAEVSTEELAIKAVAEQMSEHVEELQGEQPCEETPEVEQKLVETSEEASIEDFAEQIPEGAPEQTEQVENVEAEAEVSTEELAIKAVAEQMVEQVEDVQADQPCEETTKVEKEVTSEEATIKAIAEHTQEKTPEQIELSSAQVETVEVESVETTEEKEINAIAERISEHAEVSQEDVQVEQASVPADISKEQQENPEEVTVKAIVEQVSEQVQLSQEEVVADQTSVPEETPQVEQQPEVSSDEVITEQVEIPQEQVQAKQTSVPEALPEKESEVIAEEVAVRAVAEQVSEQVEFVKEQVQAEQLSVSEETSKLEQEPEMNTEEIEIKAVSKQIEDAQAEQSSVSEETTKEKQEPEVITEEVAVKTIVEQSAEQAEQEHELPAVELSVRTVSFEHHEGEHVEPEVDSEEATLKALATKMEEAEARHVEEAEIQAVAEDLVSEVLEQAKEIANERHEEADELPSYDPVTQKLVDGQVINRFDVEVQESGEASTSTGQEVVEEVVQPVEVKQVSEAIPETAQATDENVMEPSSVAEPVEEEVLQSVEVKTVAESAPINAKPEEQDLSAVVQPSVEEVVQPVEVQEAITVSDAVVASEVLVSETSPVEETIVETDKPVSEEVTIVEDIQEEVLESVTEQNAVPEHVAVHEPSDTVQESPVTETVEVIQESAPARPSDEQVLESVVEVTGTSSEAEAKDGEPSLPEYDPETQKLVDGIVIERFEKAETPNAVLTSETIVSEAQPTDIKVEEETTASEEVAKIELETTSESLEVIVQDAELVEENKNGSAEVSAEVVVSEQQEEVQELKETTPEAVEEQVEEEVEQPNETVVSEAQPAEIKIEQELSTETVATEKVAKIELETTSVSLEVAEQETEPVEDNKNASVEVPAEVVASEQQEEVQESKETVPEAVEEQVNKRDEVQQSAELSQVVEQELSLTANLDDVCKLVAEAQNSYVETPIEEVSKQSEVLAEAKPVPEESQANQIIESKVQQEEVQVEVVDPVAEQKTEAVLEHSNTELVEEVASVEESVKSDEQKVEDQLAETIEASVPAKEAEVVSEIESVENNETVVEAEQVVEEVSLVEESVKTGEENAEVTVAETIEASEQEAEEVSEIESVDTNETTLEAELVVKEVASVEDTAKSAEQKTEETVVEATNEAVTVQSKVATAEAVPVVEEVASVEESVKTGKDKSDETVTEAIEVSEQEPIKEAKEVTEIEFAETKEVIAVPVVEEVESIAEIVKTGESDELVQEAETFAEPEQSVETKKTTVEAVPEEQPSTESSNTAPCTPVVPSKEELVESAPSVQIEQPAVELETVSETIITTEVVNDARSTEPVIYSGDETAAGVIVISDASVESKMETLFVEGKVDVFPRGPIIEEVTDESVQEVVEGTASEEHVIKVDVEKRDTVGMISEVMEESEEVVDKQEAPASPVTIEPVLDIISEHQEEVEEVKPADAKHGEQVGNNQDHYTAEKLEHARQEALVERTLTEATVVASEIESIVDHIITEKILQTTLPEVDGGSQESGVPPRETVSEPQRLATSAAKVVESIVIEEKVTTSSAVTSTVPASGGSLEDEACSSINQLSTSSDTNQSEVLTIRSQSAQPLEPSSSPSPVIELNSCKSDQQEQMDDTKNSVTSILDTKIEPAIAQTTTLQSEPSTTSSSESSSSRSSTATVISTLEQLTTSEAAEATTILDQVPTSASNVTNPKFLTLNLVNYSLSESSGNNSNSSASASAFKTQEVAAGPSPAGTADVSAAVETAETSDQLMELDLLRKKLDETEQAMTKIIANMGCIPKGQETEETDNTEPAEKETPAAATESNDHVVKHVDNCSSVATANSRVEAEPEVNQEEEERHEVAVEEPEVAPKVVKKREAGAVPKKKRQTTSSGSDATSGQEVEGRGLSKSGSSVKVIPMEKKVAYEPGHHASISRPTSPVQSVTLDPSIVECDAAESKCVLLETKVPQSSKVLVANSDHSVEKLDATATSVRTEEDTPFDLNLIVVFESVSNLNQGRSLELNVLLGSEPTTTTVVNSGSSSTATRLASPTREVVLSGKMKLSLVKLDDNEKPSTDDVVVKAKNSSQDKKPSRFGPNEE